MPDGELEDERVHVHVVFTSLCCMCVSVCVHAVHPQIASDHTCNSSYPTRAVIVVVPLTIGVLSKCNIMPPS